MKSKKGGSKQEQPGDDLKVGPGLVKPDTDVEQGKTEQALEGEEAEETVGSRTAQRRPRENEYWDGREKEESKVHGCKRRQGAAAKSSLCGCLTAS